MEARRVELCSDHAGVVRQVPQRIDQTAGLEDQKIGAHDKLVRVFVIADADQALGIVAS